MKKLISLLVAALLIVSTFVFGGSTAFAADVYESENNDSRERANYLSLGDTIHGTLVYKSGSGEVDYYKFVLPSDGRINVKFTNNKADCSDYFYFNVYQQAESNSRRIVYSSDYLYCRDSGSFTSPTLGLPKGTYYIAVDGTTDNHVPYGVTVQFTAKNNWETEYNESSGTADPLDLGKTRYGTLVYKSGSGEVDYYKFVLPSDGRINVKFTNNKADCSDYFYFNVYQQAESNSRRIVYSSDYLYCRDSGSFTSPTLGLPKGTYYIAVDGTTDNHVPYGVTVQFTAKNNWETEYNESSGTADPLDLGKTRYGTLVYKSGSGEVDYYKFIIKSNDIYTVKLTNENKSADGYEYFHIYKYTGNNQISGYYESKYLYPKDKKVLSSGLLNLDAGTYYVCVDGSVKDRYSKYGICVDFGVGKLTGLKVTGRTTSSIKLAWKAAQNASGYEVQKKVNGKWTAAGSATGTKYSVTKLKAGAVYELRARAFRETPTGKVYSAWKTIKNLTKPETVTAGTPKTNSKHQIAAYWTAVANKTGYRVQIASDKDFKKVVASKLVSAKSTSFKTGNFTKGKTYYIRVKAYVTFDGVNYSGSWSKVKSIKCN